MDVGNRNRRESERKKETHIEMEKEEKTDRKGRGLEETREGA